MESYIMLLIFGILLIPLGVVNLMGNISTIHWYNRRKVRAEDVPKYGRLMGLATLIISGSIILTAILLLLFSAEIFYAITLGGTIAGVILILYAQFKYNKGIF